MFHFLFLALMDALHKAAFRGGLSNSLFCPPFMLGKHSAENLHSFVNENFAASRTSVVGLGVSHDVLESHVGKLFDLGNPAGADGASRYGGGKRHFSLYFCSVYLSFLQPFQILNHSIDF